MNWTWKLKMSLYVSEGREVRPRGHQTGCHGDQQPPGQSGFTGSRGKKYTWSPDLCSSDVSSIGQTCQSPRSISGGLRPLGLLGSSECLRESLCPHKSCFPAAETDELPAEQRLKRLSRFSLHSPLRRRKHESEQTTNTQHSSVSCSASRWDASDCRWPHVIFSGHVGGNSSTEDTLKAALIHVLVLHSVTLEWWRGEEPTMDCYQLLLYSNTGDTL